MARLSIWLPGSASSVGLATQVPLDSRRATVSGLGDCRGDVPHAMPRRPLPLLCPMSMGSQTGDTALCGARALARVSVVAKGVSRTEVAPLPPTVWRAEHSAHAWGRVWCRVLVEPEGWG